MRKVATIREPTPEQLSALKALGERIGTSAVEFLLQRNIGLDQQRIGAVLNNCSEIEQLLGNALASQLTESMDREAGWRATYPYYELVKDFEITVPGDYKHSRILKQVCDAPGLYRPRIRYSDCWKDSSFNEVSHQLKPKQKLTIKIFKAKYEGSGQEHLRFLESQGAILVGAQGAALIYEHYSRHLPFNGVQYASLDRKERLCRYSRERWIPMFRVNIHQPAKIFTGYRGRCEPEYWYDEFSLLPFSQSSSPYILCFLKQ